MRVEKSWRTRLLSEAIKKKKKGGEKFKNPRNFHFFSRVDYSFIYLED